MKQWYYAKTNEQIGPVLEDKLLTMLQNNEIDPNTMIWTEGMSTWATAKDAGLLDIVSTSTIHNTNASTQEFITPPLPPRPSSNGIGRGAYFGLMILISLLTGLLGPELSILLIIPSLFVGGMRFRNIGYSPWLIVLLIIPIVNLVVGYRCLAFPSNYAQTKQSDSAMKIVSGIYIFLIILLVLAFVIPALSQ